MHEDNNPMGIWILYALASALLWITLVFLKVLGVVRISWIGVVLGLFWLPLVLMCLICGVAALVILIAHIKRRHRRKVTDRRIIRHPSGEGDRNMDTAGSRRPRSGVTRRRIRDQARGRRDRPTASWTDRGSDRKHRKAGGQINGL